MENKNYILKMVSFTPKQLEWLKNRKQFTGETVSSYIRRLVVKEMGVESQNV